MWLRGEEIKKLSLLADKVGLKHNLYEEEIEVTATNFADMVELMFLNDIKYTDDDDKDVQNRLKALKVPKNMELKEEVIYPEFGITPYQHQKEFLMFGLEKERVLLADGMGLGKSLMAIMLSEYLKAHYKFDYILVVNGVYNNQFNWESELSKFTDSTYRVLGSREITQGPRKGKRRVGGSVEKIEDLNSELEETYLITNVASLRNKKIVDKLREMVYNNSIGLVVVDEIHYCASTDSQQGKNLNSIRPRFRLGMSGTPFNDPMDMYAIEKWLGTTYKNSSDYRTTYGQFMITDKSRQIARMRRSMPFGEYVFTEPEKFSKDIQRFMIRRMDKLKDLPTLIFQDVLVELGEKQREAYDEVSQVGTITKEVTSIEQLQQELGKSSYYEERKLISAPHLLGIEEDVKLETVKELLREIIANGKTAIVYGFFIDTVSNYAKELEKEFPGQGNYITDDTEDVFKEIENFQEGKGSFLVGGVKKIGTGFTITRADYVIYADRPATWNDYEQSFMRAWRNGRTEPVTVIKILAIDTWDDKMSFNILERKRQSDSVLGGVHDSRENVVDGRYDR